jgi:hypothetical protein
MPTVINRFPGQDVDFFLRIHRHLPNALCGNVFGDCHFSPRADKFPLNMANRPIEECREDEDFVKQEEQIQQAIKDAGL